MTQNTQAVSPLRQRMIEDMRARKLSPKTQSGYIRAVEKLTMYLGRSPATASAEDLRRFQLHLVDRGVSSITLNATITALRFFFETTLDLFVSPISSNKIWCLQLNTLCCSVDAHLNYCLG